MQHPSSPIHPYSPTAMSYSFHSQLVPTTLSIPHTVYLATRDGDPVRQPNYRPTRRESESRHSPRPKRAWNATSYWPKAPWVPRGYLHPCA
eukprot:scaffold42779_cov191-Amphora_coffeaeformis.AAC.5